MAQHSAWAASSHHSKKHPVGLVNLNAATSQQLDVLPGVGEKAVTRIIEYRTKTPFKKVEELVRVKGFGRKRFVKLKPFLAVSGETTLQEVAESQVDSPGKP